MAKMESQQQTALEKFWSRSVSASVLEDYRTGNVHIIDTRKPADEDAVVRVETAQ